jgi:uncharacterized RDD family membrane protein YckC
LGRDQDGHHDGDREVDRDRGRGPSGGQGGPAGAQAAATTTPDGVPLAAAVLRLVARFFDYLVVGMLTAIAGVYYLQQIWLQARPTLQEVLKGNPGADLTPLLEDPAFQQLSLRYGFVGLLVGGVYSVTLTHLFGGTLGKLSVGIRVRSWDEPGRPTWGQALARWLTRDVIGAVSFAGIGTVYGLMDAMWLLFDPRRQCLHDKLPATVVVRHF